MTSRLLLVGLVSTMLASACGSTPPTTPTPVDPPPSNPGNPPPPVVPPTLGITELLSFGDSMTAGTTSPTVPGLTITAGPPQSYPFKLQALLGARYTAQTITVGNAGVAGEKAVVGRDRLLSAMRAASKPPQLVILLEGANDLNAPDFAGVTPVVNAIEDMVREAQGRGAQVMVATLPPQRPGPGAKATDPVILNRYNAELRTMASKKGAILVDVNAQLPLSLIGQDGLHPTEAGYQKVAEIFFDAIKARFETSAGG